MDRRQLPKGVALAEWLCEREDDLRKSASIANNGLISDEARDQYAVVAYQLLPIFTANPGAWNTVLKLPVSDAPLCGYLIDWYRNVDPKDRGYVGSIMEKFSMDPRGLWGTAGFTGRVACSMPLLADKRSGVATSRDQGR